MKTGHPEGMPQERAAAQKKRAAHVEPPAMEGLAG